MAILSVNGIYKSYNGLNVLEDINFSVNRGEKIAIIGDNGEGKSTLLKIIIKETLADKGFVYLDPNAKIGYLSQRLLEDEENTLIEEMDLAFIELKRLEKELDKITLALEKNHDDALINKYSETQERFMALGGYDYKYLINQMLGKFGFSESYNNRKLKTFSGGERTRAALVKLLLLKPSILLLDEPTNHLDLIMIEWLEKYLKSFAGTLILVSHDQIFIDNIVSKVVEIENHKATMYSGNYTFYINEKQLHYEQELKKYNLQEKEIQRYEMLIRKFKPKPTKTAFAKSLETKLSKMERIEKPRNNEKRIKAEIESSLDPYDVKMHVCEELLFGYDSKPLTEPFNLVIKNQDKICIMGKNGSGKTTLLNTIMNNKNYLSGTNRDCRLNIKYFYFDQTQKILDDNLNLFDTIHNEFFLMDNTEVRSLLGRFLFSNDDVFKMVKDLSGGERIRLIFALITLRKYDVLYLDEPTNHLDFTTKRIISDILEDYQGTIIMVSHDRYFVNRVANKIIYLQDGKFIIEDGNYEKFQELHEIIDNSFLVKRIKKEEKEIKENKPKSINNSKLKAKLEKEIEEKMLELEEVNAKIEIDDGKYDWVSYKELADKAKEIEEKIEILMDEFNKL